MQEAVKSGRLTRAAAKAYRVEIARAVHLARVLPAGRREHVEVALEQVGALGKRLTGPRAKGVTRTINRLAWELRDQADVLVDAFGIPDSQLGELGPQRA